MSDEVTRHESEARAGRSVSRDHYDWMVEDRDSWKRTAGELAAERDEWKQQVESAKHYAKVDADALHSAQQWVSGAKEKINVLTAERDNWQQRAETLEQAAQRLTVDNCRLVDERDEVNSELAAQLEAKRVTIAQRDAAEENCRNLHAENEGLRADMLANPPEIAQQQLAIERKRALELQDDYNLKVTMNETLMDALKQMEVTLESSRHECHQLKIQLSNTMAARDFGVQVQAEALERALPREVVGLLMSIESSVNMARKMLEQKSR